MTTHRQLPYSLFILAVILLGIQPAGAKDTDVYLKTPAIIRDDAPNVLIILDNSGSMEINSITSSKPAFDPATNYCNVSGAPAGNICNGTTVYDRIFWTYNDLSNPPSSSTTQWFDATKNKCFNSDSALGTLGTGKYSGDKIASSCSTCSTSDGKSWGILKNETNSTIVYVDCQSDNVSASNTVADGLLLTDGKYPKGDTYASSGSGYAFATTDGSPALLTANYLAYLRNTTLSSSQTRMQIAKSAVKSIIDSYKNVRLGLMVFNANDDATNGPHGGRLLMKVDNMSDTRRTQMKTVVDGICGYRNCTTMSGGYIYTPLSETLWEAYSYLAGLSVEYGDDWSSGTPARDTTAESDGKYITPFKYGCQKAFIILVTDGDPTHDANADSKIKGLSGLSTSSCAGYNSVANAGDYAATNCLKDLAGWMANNDVPAVPTEMQTVATYTVSFGDTISAGGSKLLEDTAAAGKGKFKAANNIDDLTLALDAAMTDAFEANASFSAPSLSINAFNKLYNRDDVYFALFTPDESVAWDGNIKKLKLCNKTDIGCTFGEVIDATGASAIDTSTSQIKKEAKSQWSSVADGPEVILGGAGEQITKDAATPRTLHTYRGLYSDLTSANNAVAIEAASGNTVYDAAINDPTILGLTDTSGSSTTTNTTDTDAVTKLINWMRGQDAYDTDADGNTDETRRWNFADPLHSRPVAVTFGAEPDGDGNPDPTKPVIKLLVGTNDGMVRMLSDDTGEEEWAFMPQELLANQYALSQDAQDPHTEGMDDSPAFLVIDNNKDGVINPTDDDKVYMYIGMRRGGENLYAFDVTPLSTMTSQTATVTPKLLWVIEGGSGNFAQLGQTWSRPKVVRIRAKCNPSSDCDDGDISTPPELDSQSRMVLIFGGGYDTQQDSDNPGADSVGNAIYIVNPFTGERLWWVSGATGANLVLTKMKYSIPSEITALDTNGDKSVDRLYVGDTGGQVWRIDLGYQIGAAGDAGSSGYVFADIGCGSTSGAQRIHDDNGDCPVTTTRQDLRKFFYPPDVAMVKDATYSASENYDLVAIGSGDREDPLDLLTTSPSVKEAVHNRIYAFRDYDYKTGKPVATVDRPFPPDVITEKDMYDATDNKLGTLSGAALQTEINNNVKNKKGWYFDLMEASEETLVNGLTTKWVGEKVLAKPVIYNSTLFFTTFIPANDTTATHTCKANEGEGRYYEVNYLNAAPIGNLSGDSTPDRYGFAGGGIPSEVIIVIREGGVTGLVGTSGGAKQVDAGSGTNRYKTFWWDE